MFSFSGIHGSRGRMSRPPAITSVVGGTVVVQRKVLNWFIKQDENS